MYAGKNHQKINKIRSLLQQQLYNTKTDTIRGHWNKSWPLNSDNQQPKTKSVRLPSSSCQLCKNTVRVNSKRLMCIHCISSVHLQWSTQKAILIYRAHEGVSENCHFKELCFSGLREFQEMTVTSPTKIDSLDYENNYMLDFKSHRKHLRIGYLKHNPWSRYLMRSM